jgi:hypothetical protein
LLSGGGGGLFGGGGKFSAFSLCLVLLWVSFCSFISASSQVVLEHGLEV